MSSAPTATKSIIVSSWQAARAHHLNHADSGGADEGAELGTLGVVRGCCAPPLGCVVAPA